MTKPQPIPEGYGTVTRWVVTKDTRRLLEFIKDAFDAEELGRVEVEGGAIGHAEARIGDSVIMMFDSPFPVTTPGLLRLYVENGDAVFRRAVAAGATSVTRLTELAWGDRVGRVRDPALAENLVRAGHAACSYSWRMPPRRSRLGMSRRAIVSGSATCAGNGYNGRAFAMPW